MPLVDANPVLVRDAIYRQNDRAWTTTEIYRYKDVGERIYEWPFSGKDAEGIADHSATYGTGNWEMVYAGPEVDRETHLGAYREIYKDFSTNTWTYV